MNMTGIVIDKEYMNQKYVPKFFRRRKIRKQCNGCLGVYFRNF